VCAEIVGSGGDSAEAVTQSEDMGGMSADSDWHALSQKEEVDLDTIMSQCDFAISNAEKFADQLSRDLSVLDGVNVFLLMFFVLQSTIRCIICTEKLTGKLPV